MTIGEVHIGDVGTIFRITFTDETGAAVDVSSATVKQIILTKSTGTKLTKTATVTTDGTNGQVQYTSITGDLDVGGRWQMQGHVEMPAGKWSSDVLTFIVHANL